MPGMAALISTFNRGRSLLKVWLKLDRGRSSNEFYRGLSWRRSSVSLNCYPNQAVKLCRMDQRVS